MSITFAVNTEVTPGKMPDRFDNEASLMCDCALIDAGATSCVDSRTRYVRVESGFCAHDFLIAVQVAFSGHYPLALRPQHFWLLILQAVSRHVNANAEALRSQWVAHEGKKTLSVRRDAFVFGEANDWASVIDGAPDSFLAQLRAHCLPETIALTDSPCAGTTAIEQVAMAATTMSLVQAYFGYRCMTTCGFPSITLEGTHADWAALRPAAAALLERCRMTEWSAVLCPLLDKIADQYAAIEADARAVDVEFWESMLKVGGFDRSAGPWMSGWLVCLFPTLESGKPNPSCVSHTALTVRGAEWASYPRGDLSVDVMWSCHATDYPLQLTSGFVGFEIDDAGNICPHVAWWLCKNTRNT